ncbi:DUF4158 domain-containing protein [Microtetraspora sp. AC03309]|nr:DUF4158 domain-containing protein [Microtetraspora sp. AC03309]MCC5581989.1 DUF4158 domain-containing protein [Microtetraspora sp. AC03309]
MSDEEATAYGRYTGPPSRAELEKLFFLDDADRELIAKRRGEASRRGFALQVTTARFVGRFLPDPLEMPTEVLDYLAAQLGIADASVVKQYTERRQTPFDHQEEIRKAYGLRDFAEAEDDFAQWVDARAWNTGDSAKSIFTEGVAWLRTERVLLPGVTTLARLVARVREQAIDRLHQSLHAALSPQQRAVLELLLEVTEYGEEISLEQVWESIDAVVPRRELRTAVAAVTGMVPPPEADDDGPMRALLAERIGTVSGFLKTLTTVIEFGATAEAARVLEATKALPRLLDGRKKKVTEADMDAGLVTGSWKRLVHRPGPNGSTVDKNAYTMCVLTRFHRHLKRRDIYAQASARWRPVDLHPPQPQVLRLQTRSDLAQHDQRPGCRARRQGRDRHRPRLPAHDRRAVPPRRRPPPRGHRHRHPLRAPFRAAQVSG